MPRQRQFTRIVLLNGSGCTKTGYVDLCLQEQDAVAASSTDH